jgi:hypothetical protein
MNVYIYDDYLNKSKYTRILNKIEIRLTDLNLNGKIIRLEGIKNIKDVIQNEIKNGVKTIITVGNNQTINKVIGSIIDNELYGFLQKNIVFGIIPVGENNSIADSLGIKKEEAACNLLLARRIKKIDIGVVNNSYYFLNKAEIEMFKTKITINDEYSLETDDRSIATIYNLPAPKDINHLVNANPVDGKLNLFIKSKDQTSLINDSFDIDGPNELILDDVMAIKPPLNIKTIKEKLNIIVGKERSFE